MEAAQVGMVRDSMRVNPLLIRPTLGRMRSKGLWVPGPDFVYGAATVVRDGGVSEAISCWHTHSPACDSRAARSRRPEKDFVTLNREGVKSGLVTAKEHQRYRATHDVPRRAPAKPGSRTPGPPRLPPDMTFGIPPRPSTPISDVLEHKYAQRWQVEQQAKGRALLEHRIKKSQRGIPETRTSILRKHRPVTEPTPLWKMPRFQQVGPVLDTFRDPEARKKAFSAHHTDSVARRGNLGQGTYKLG